MKQFALTVLLCLAAFGLSAQVLTLPAGGGNSKRNTSMRIGVTDVTVHWEAPGVKGREGKIWGTNIVHYGFENLGFGTALQSPWRAGANENTTIEFSTDVNVQGKTLPAGKYGFFIAVYPDSCTLIFSTNNQAWGSYFYDPAADALSVTAYQQKNQPNSCEWLSYEFSEPTENSAILALEWEHWRIPFMIAVDLNLTVVQSLRQELQGNSGFYDANLFAAADFCLQHDYNLEEALIWASQAVANNPSFTNHRLKAAIESKLGRVSESEKTLQAALDKANVQELHQYGRQLIADKKPTKAMEIFQLNFKKNGDAWPVHVGLMRGYSASGDFKKALEQAQIALKQAPDDTNRKNLEAAVKTLSEGKALMP